MFCKSCGQVIEDGWVFCKACGTAVSSVLEAAGGDAAMVTVGAPDDTPVKPPSVVAPPAAPRLSAPTLPAFMPPSPPPPGVGYGPGWQPPSGPAGRGGRSGLIAGIVAAVIIVLAGVGAGVYFGFFRDGDGGATGTSTTTKTTVVGSSSTGTSVTPSSSARTTTTVRGGSTTQTIPGLTTSTSSRTTTTEDLTTVYLTATDAMVAQLGKDDARVPQLATTINNTAPKVPTSVRDELQTMLDELDAGNEELVMLEVPAGFEDSNLWLGEAITHMANRIYATIQGIEAMWDTGKIGSSTPYFDTGRTERDEYRKAMVKYHDFLPIE